MHKKSTLKNLAFLYCSVIVLLFLSGCVFYDNSHPAIIEPYNKNGMQCANRNVVLLGGCFDILHSGHINFLQKSKAAGDYLVVALESDDSIKKMKHRIPTHNQKERAEILSLLRCVDCVVLLPPFNGFDDYNQLVASIRPKIIAVTAEDPQIVNKQKQAKAIGAEVKIIDLRVDGFSSTGIRKKLNKEGGFID